MIDKGQRQDSPPLQGRGRGWGLSVKELDRRHDFAREMRNAPTEAERRLWQRLRGSQLDGLKFRRQSVIGPFMVDFHCPAAALVVEVDGDTHDDRARDARRDRQLADMGLMVFRATNREVMKNMEGVLASVLNLARTATPNLDMPHPNPSPGGEGLSG